jgi:adenylate cyclase
VKKSRIYSIVLGLAVVFCIVALRWWDPFIVKTIRDTAFDQFQRLSPREYIEAPVRIVDIDEESLMAYGQWPWPRTRLAELVERLSGLGATAIVFDVLFAEPDRMSPAEIVRDPTIRDYLQRTGGMAAGMALPDSDALFAETVKGKPVVFGFAMARRGAEERPLAKWGFASTGENPLSAPPQFSHITPLLKPLQEAASGIGSVSFDPGSTSVVRIVPMLVSDGAALYPSLVLEALRVAQEASTYLITNAPEVEGSIASVRVGDVEVKTTAGGGLWMHYAEERPERYVSVKTILEDYEAPATRNKIEGHIVFIGTSAAGLLDIRTTSLGQTVPGVSIHAQAVEQILSSTFLSRPDWADGLEIALVLALGILIMVIGTSVGPFMGIVAGAAIALASAAASWAAFRYNQFLIDPTMPVASALGTLFVMTAFRFLVSDRERRTIRRAFSQYLAPSLLQRIESSPDALKLGGVERQLTLMFMDVRGFTSISEVLSPTELVEFMNKLLNELSQPIIREEGTLDKFIGDSIMAFWNAPVDVPDHVKRAATAALDMRAALHTLNSQDAFNLKWRLGDSAEIGIGIGINTGLACVGNMGAETRFNYSAVGDAVNLAARIESSAKHIGHDIIISESAAAALQDMAMLEAGHLELKGKSARQRLYVLVGDKELAASPDFWELASFHETLIRHLASGEIPATKRALAKCLEKVQRHGWSTLRPFYEHIVDRRTDFVN